MAREHTSQVVEERAETVPFSISSETVAKKSTRKKKSKKNVLPEEEATSITVPAADQLTPLQIAEPAPCADGPNMEISSVEVFPVVTRAQSKKKLKEIEAHELATAQSQVVLTPPQQEPVAEQGSDSEVSNACEDAGTDGPNSSAEPGDCEAETRQEPQRNTGITKQQLLQEQQQDDETVKFIRESADEDSPFMVIGDILYWKRQIRMKIRHSLLCQRSSRTKSCKLVMTSLAILAVRN